MYLRNTIAVALMAFTAFTEAAPAKRQEQHPEPLRITEFGERPAFSPNSSTIAFVSMSYGDIFSYDIATGEISLITHYPSAGYLRAQYLINGDLLLLGAREYEDYALTREEDIEMWILKPGTLEPIPLGHKVWEGIAISYDNLHVSWANTHGQYPEWIGENETVVFEADIEYNATGYPSLANKREMFRDDGAECLVEPQDFRHNDTELIYSCYRVNTDVRVAEVRGFNRDTGEVVTYRKVEGEYNEVEGIFPGGEYTTVESAHDQENPGSNYAIEIWRLKLEPNSEDFVRLTWMSDIPGNKAGNPVVSPDGKYMTWSLGRALDNPPGAGYGLYLLDLEQV